MTCNQALTVVSSGQIVGVTERAAVFHHLARCPECDRKAVQLTIRQWSTMTDHEWTNQCRAIRQMFKDDAT
jgi:hypothetical protein